MDSSHTPLVDRRGFLRGALAGLAWTAALPASLAAAEPALPATLRGALEKSQFVYVSPIKSNGSESTCHAEVWYGWLDSRIVVIVDSSRWKARSISGGLDRARIWVGDYGRWKGMIRNNESFRKGPSFEARGRAIGRDEALLERLLATYRAKYPNEIDRWAGRMRDGHADGSRSLIVYEPLPG